MQEFAVMFQQQLRAADSMIEDNKKRSVGEKEIGTDLSEQIKVHSTASSHHSIHFDFVVA